VLQGDSVNVNSIREILLALEKRGISAENIIFGMGGKLLQAEIDRDTFKFAIKTSYTVIDGKPIDIIKNPIELNHLGEIVPSFKKSKQGKLKLIIDENGLFKTVPQTQDNSDDILQDVFRNGELVRYQTLEDIRKISYAK
jgi:nicotinamide phosphoribosyltransferase